MPPAQQFCGMRAVVAAMILTAAAADAQVSRAPDKPTRDTLELAKRLYLDDKLAEALPLFRAAARRSPGSAEVHVWVAEAARRSGAIDEARREARRALALDGCNALAHDVLANALNPQYVTDSVAHYDSSWTHLRRAVECDSTEGNAWLSLVYEAARVGDTALARRALRALVNTGFLTPVQMTNARWMLSLLPPRAVLITAADMDTYPVLAAQEAFGLRPDVAVINTGILELEWYALHVFERYDLPLPRTAYDTSKTLSDNVVGALRAAAADGTLGRPLVISNTFGQEYPHVGPGFATLAGPYWLVSGDSSLSIDTVAVRRAMTAANELEWRGIAIAPQDLSPIRRTVLHPAVMTAYVAINAGEMLRDRDPAFLAAQLRWAKAFLRRAGFEEAAAEKWIVDIRSVFAK
jgi:tetratricopeptide (TPR) repeat protein